MKKSFWYFFWGFLSLMVIALLASIFFKAIPGLALLVGFEPGIKWLDISVILFLIISMGLMIIRVTHTPERIRK
ncbi:MAG: hypothetical protein ABH805_01675 [Candidatus Nealsonbacteria bacterium]